MTLRQIRVRKLSFRYLKLASINLASRKTDPLVHSLHVEVLWGRKDTPPTGMSSYPLLRLSTYASGHPEVFSFFPAKWF